MNQDEKRKKLKRQDTFARLHNVETFLNSLISDPSRYHLPELGFVRDFVNHVNAHRIEFMPSSEHDGIAVANNSRNTKCNVSLTKGFCRGILDSTWDCGQRANLQVVSYKTEYVNPNVESFLYNQNEKIASLTLADGDGNGLLAKISTHLTDYVCQLKAGMVVNIDLYTPITFRCGESSNGPIHPAVLLLRFDILGIMDMSVQKETVSMITRDAPVSRPLLDNERKSVGNDTQHSDSNEPVPHPEELCTEQKRLCSVYGVNYRICICKATPPRSISLDAISMNCHFATKKVENMSPSLKRNLLYWYYTTNIYSINGTKKQKQLPDCLVYKIRCLFPNKQGHPYKCFKK